MTVQLMLHLIKGYFCIIRKCHDGEGGIENTFPWNLCFASFSKPRDANDDSSGWIFHPHTNDGFFFLLTFTFIFKKDPRIPENADNAVMQHNYVVFSL